MCSCNEIIQSTKNDDDDDDYIIIHNKTIDSFILFYQYYNTAMMKIMMRFFNSSWIDIILFNNYEIMHKPSLIQACNRPRILK